MISKTLGMLGAASLLAGASAAAAQSAAPLGLAQSPPVRAGAAAGEANELTGSMRWVVGAVVLGLLVWGAIELLDDGTDAFPVSP